MKYYILEPEVPGELSNATILDYSIHPPGVERLHVLIHGWFGDDLLTVHPAFFVSSRLREAIERGTLGGWAFADMQAEPSEEFEEFFPGLALPQFSWLRPLGQLLEDDFSTLPRGDLIVSEAALSLLRAFQLTHGKVTEYPR